MDQHSMNGPTDAQMFAPQEPPGEAMLLVAARDIERRLAAVAWAFDRSGAVEDAAAEVLAADIEVAITDVDYEPTDNERAWEAICYANDMRRGEDAA